jgi:predicted GH43/DUF377 family glycosyl hydrolase
MKWRKLGNIFSAHELPGNLMTHASVPIAEVLDLNLIRIYFSSRDAKQRSHVLFIDIDIRNPQKILNYSKTPVLSPGDIGCFDDCGTMGSCILQKGKNKYLYYIGWNLCTTVPFRNSIGLAVWDNTKFKRCFQGPILDRTKDEPHFVASNHVLFDDSKFKMWYLSCLKWELSENHLIHNYHIKYSESDDGITWKRNNVVALDFKDEYEYAISVPRVINDNGVYKMWFSSRARKNISTYRIGYAESSDGINFSRKDDEVGIDVSHSGWDSEMVCYPFVFDINGSRYMLYNGNRFGKTGFGLAELEKD